MRNPELFHRTVKILVDAYLNETLDRLDCAACAVGNLISGNLEARPATSQNSPLFKRGNELYYVPWGGYTANNDYAIKLNIVELIGYNNSEIERIEKSFMGRPTFEGLMSVIEILCDIHEMNTTTKEEAKALFVKV